MAESWNQTELIRAGWMAFDLDWEDAAEACATALASGDLEEAKARAGAALRIARDEFEAADPRLATSLVLQGLALAAADPETKTSHLLDEAAQVWAACTPWIEKMTAPRTARSSMFHMRMEQRHRDTYEERWRVKWGELVEEAKARVEALKGGAPSSQSLEAAAQRWRRERPAMLNDTRKLLAAVLLTPEVN